MRNVWLIMVALLVGAAYCSDLAIATDNRQAFPTLEDADSNAFTVTKAAEGDPVSGKNTHGVLVGKNDAGLFSYLKVDSEGRLITSALTGFGAAFAFGDVASSSTTIKAVTRTTYTEQTSNAQRSFNSNNANDTAAGTGARTITFTYYTIAGAGPFTETKTLNGTGCVATTANDIAHIDNIKVTTAGSTGSNVGIIRMFVNSACGGGTIGTIAATNNRTFWAHHYVPSGKTANVTGISAGSTSTTVGCGALFTMTAYPWTVANAAEIQVSDFVRLYGQSSTFARSYASPIKIVGPARIRMYVTPECSSSITYRAAIDFFEP